MFRCCINVDGAGIRASHYDPREEEMSEKGIESRQEERPEGAGINSKTCIVMYGDFNYNIRDCSCSESVGLTDGGCRYFKIKIKEIRNEERKDNDKQQGHRPEQCA